MKKFLKWFSLLAAAGAAIGLVIAYFCKSSDKENIEDDSDFTEDEDFDLDVDLKPASDRESVSLNRDADSTDGKASDETSDETDAEE